MAHPRMFDDDDPHLTTVRELALALRGAAEKVSHGAELLHASYRATAPRTLVAELDQRS